MTNKLEIKRQSDSQAVFTRKFAASPEAVYRAHTEPNLVQQWLLGPEGWSMPVCLIDLRPGGSFRYEWSNPDGRGFYITGEYLEIVANQRIRQVERMYLPDPTPDNQVEVKFEAHGDGTLMTLTMELPSKEVLDAMLAGGMADGMEESYARLESSNLL